MRNPAHITLWPSAAGLALCLLAAPEGIARMQEAHPDVPIVTAAVDSHLNDHGRIFITLPGFGPLEAEVVWRIGESYGCAFVAPLHPAVFDHILAKFPSLGPG